MVKKENGSSTATLVKKENGRSTATKSKKENNTAAAALKKKIDGKTAKVGVIGMGYIGLSLLDAFGQAGFPLLAFDSNPQRVNMIKRGESYLNFLDLTTLFSLEELGHFHPSSNPAILDDADIIVISVSTSLDQYRVPDLTKLLASFKTVVNTLKKGLLIVLQSSTYPGTTEEDLLPLLEQTGLKVGVDFFLAHVPEVADIGNPKFSFTQVPRIVSGITPECQAMAKLLYEKIGCKTVPASSPSVAEAAKILQNAFRLINISFVNEMKILFDSMGIDVWEVIAAATSKPFGIMPFYPGPGIGGDCIPIVPFYLSWKAKSTDGPATMIEQAGRIESLMPMYVYNKIVQALNQHNKTVRQAKILILGVAYKKNVNDIRESPGIKLITLLKKNQAAVEYHDPHVKSIQGDFCDGMHIHMKSIEFDYDVLHLYDAVVIVTDHSYYDWEKIVANSQLIIDCRNATASVKGHKKKIFKA